MCTFISRSCVFILLILSSLVDTCPAQRLYLPPTPDLPSPSPASAPEKAPSPPKEARTNWVLKTYPDGTRKIVPLGGLNFYDDGKAFGGPPILSIYEEPAPNAVGLSPKSPERLAVAPIGTPETATSLNTTLPASVDPFATSTMVAAADPMGGGSSADPMGGGSSGVVDPLAGSAPKTVPPLQTVSGKPAPIVGDTTMLQLGEWESFFLNAGIGGSLQGQLTSRRVWNGQNREAYPLARSGALGPLGFTGDFTGENFTFQPGFRMDVEFGYNFYEWLGIGLQTGLTYNGLQNYTVSANGDLTLAGYGTLTGGGSFVFPADGELVQVPIQLNGILRWPGQVKFRPFIGGGVGAVWQQLDVNTITLGPVNVAGNYCRSAFQFGWNAQAGLTYTVDPGLDFYGAFKVLSAFMPVIGNYQFSNTYNFAVEVGIQSRF